jgi:vacuolar protein sorting-associated protein 18
VIDSAQLLPYPAQHTDHSEFEDRRGGRIVPEIPISMALTAYHFVLLSRDRLRVIRALDDKIVYEEELDLVGPVFHPF